MKKLNILMPASLIALAIGIILMIFGNPIGDYIFISGVISGLAFYTIKKKAMMEGIEKWWFSRKDSQSVDATSTKKKPKLDFDVQIITEVCEKKIQMKKLLVHFLNIKVGKTGKYPYSVEDFYLHNGTFCIVYSDGNNMETDVGGCYYETRDLEELSNILNNPEMDIYYHVPSLT